MFASTFLTGTAAVWWYTIVQANEVPTTWIDFKKAIVTEFVPEDHVRRSRERLRKLKQTTSVAKYLSDFRNIVLTVPDISKGEKWDKFCSGLKFEIRLEVMKSSGATFQDASKVALRVDSAMWSAGRTPSAFISGSGSGTVAHAPTQMEIGNVDRRRGNWDSQRQEDFRKNACFKCHKVGCRPWKHEQGRLSVNNSGVEEATQRNGTEEHESDSRSSEN